MADQYTGFYGSGGTDVLTKVEPYDSTAYPADYSATDLHRINFASKVHAVADMFNPLTLLQGPELGNLRTKQAAAPITRIDTLKNGGGSHRYTYIHPDRTMPYKMDKALHTLEKKMTFTHQDIPLAAYRETYMLSEWERQLPAFDIRAEMQPFIEEKLTWIKGVLMLDAMLGVDTEDYDASANYVIQAGGYCRSQIVAGDNSNVGQLAFDNVLTGELVSRAKEILNTGFRRAGDHTHYGRPALVGGQAYDCVCICHEFGAYDMRWNDDDFKAALTNALTRGAGNWLFTGLSAMFEYDGVLYMILKGELGERLLFNTSGYLGGMFMRTDLIDGSTTGTDGQIVDEDGTEYAPSVSGATAIVLGGNSMVHVGGRIDKMVDFEGYDNNWFERMSIAAIEGNAPLVTDCKRHSTSTTLRDLGRVLIHHACSHHNISAAP